MQMCHALLTNFKGFATEECGWQFDIDFHVARSGLTETWWIRRTCLRPQPTHWTHSRQSFPDRDSAEMALRLGTFTWEEE